MLPDDVKARVDAGAEHIKIKMRYGGVGILRKDFCDNTAQFEIDFGQPINVQCPVRIIHAIGVSSTNHLAKGFLHLFRKLEIHSSRQPCPKCEKRF